ncbi:MAG: histidine kinase [Nocardioidaceae bacterium]|nr:histidine kinase [Nocardioidaceae bacterium]
MWRYLLALGIGLVLWVQVLEEQAKAHPMLFWLDIAAGILAFVLVGWRRRWPMRIAVVTVLLTPFTSIGAGAILLASVSLATRRRWVQILIIGVLNVAASWAYEELQPVNQADPGWLIALFTLMLVAAALLWGMYVGSRRELLWTLQRRAETAEAERDLRASQARSNERARIAREMHDVLAHRISQISLQAGALAFRDDLAAADLREGLGLIRAKSHEALSDLRDVLGVLRDEVDRIPLVGPQPTYADLSVLVAEARAAGADIEFQDRVLPEPLEPVGRTIYRMVQEGITNATKHAPAAAVGITVVGTPEAGIDVTVRNRIGFGASHTPGAGLGLIGLRERAELRGGTLTHGVERQGPGTPEFFVLRAWLPWAVDAEPHVDNQGEEGSR